MPTTWTDFLRNSYGGLTGLLGYAPQTTSGYRSQADNDRVGGVANSWHLQGRSLDFTPRRGQSVAGLYSDLKASGVDWVELINEGDHVHGTFPASGVSGGNAAQATAGGNAAQATADCKAGKPAWLAWTCDTQAGWDILTGKRTNANGETVYESQWSGLVSALSKPAVRVGVFILAIALIIGALAIMAAGSKDLQAIAGSTLKAVNPAA